MDLKLDGYISQIAFAAGLQVPLKPGDILVIIGPNNCGKSQSLRDISGSLNDGRSGVVVKTIEFVPVTPLAEIQAWLEPYKNPGGVIQTPGSSFQSGQLAQRWGTLGNGLGDFLHPRVVSDLSTRSRLSDCDPVSVYNRRDAFSITHPFQRFHREEMLELKASALFRRAFKTDLVIHPFNPNAISAYAGDRPRLKMGENMRSEAYLDRIEALPALEAQGDGMRSFVSIVGRVLAEDRPIILIDEPEAFLHPPQARLLTDIIGEEAAGRQILLASHSSDVLQGLLAQHSERVSVVRLSRPTQCGSKAVLLPSVEVQTLWQDPILRFSNVMDGLFHEAVIVTEADADCRFYEAMAAATVPPSNLPDIHYTYSGGKDRLPVVVKALRALDVPVVTIADFDLLNNDVTLSRIVEAHGGDWAALKPIWSVVKTGIEEKANFIAADKFKTEMAAILRDIKPRGAVDKGDLSRIKALARNASPWDNAKHLGLKSLPHGLPTQTAKDLLRRLGEIGIFVVPVGEMEGFCDSLDGHGPRWVSEVTKRNLAEDPDLAGARQFVADIMSHLRSNLA